MYQNLLPIGSIVQLQGAEYRVMICGRVLGKSGEDKLYDYAACQYPQGLMDAELIFFNRDDIQETYFIGFQDPEELYFRKEILGKLGDLSIAYGEIIAGKQADA